MTCTISIQFSHTDPPTPGATTRPGGTRGTQRLGREAFADPAGAVDDGQ